MEDDFFFIEDKFKGHKLNIIDSGFHTFYFTIKKIACNN